ncbi:hypothetical protein NUW58_g1559 [Xylaria curta]|uniref:Uncharacterized protein n=1 Tax=Xylaria curta TaxID=42375 RepID=A0ACC1PK77_9PEZI|nr:hypothetical protein NUW58_g1559 [Xylaria curta]
MAEPPNHHTIYSDANRRRMPVAGPEPTPTGRPYYDSEDLGDVAPLGFPSLAAMQTRWSNTGTFRTFEYLNWRQLKFYETKLSYLEDQLHNLDVVEAETMNGTQKSNLPFNKRSLVDCCPMVSEAYYMPETLEGGGHMSQDELAALREKLYAQIEYTSTKHRELVGWLQRLSTFPRVCREAHDKLFQMAREYHGLENDAIGHLRAIDEYAYVNLSPVDSRIQKIWLAATPWIQDPFHHQQGSFAVCKSLLYMLAQKIVLRFLCKPDTLPNIHGSQTYNAIETDRLMRLSVALKTLFTAVFSASMILVPAGMLYLAGLSKLLSFAVVVVFGVVFATALMLVEHRIGHVAVGVAAYLAVLATFLANVT